MFIPLTVGGGISSVEDVDRLLRAGADKIAVNTAAIRRPELLSTKTFSRTGRSSPPYARIGNDSAMPVTVWHAIVATRPVTRSSSATG